MSTEEQINEYLLSHPEPKQTELKTLNQIIQQINPACKLWFLDGLNDEGKIVSNPNIGYGLLSIKYTNGKTKPFYQIGLSANTTGISI